MASDGNALRPALSSPDPDALLCALVLAPTTFSRNRFFPLFEQPELHRVRRRARRVRGIVRQLLGQGREPAQLVGTQVMENRVLLRLQIEHLSYQRTTSLAPLEAALVHYAVHRTRGGPLMVRDRELVERALRRFNLTM